MQTLIKELFDFTGRELHEAAWKANLPINHGVALSSLFEAFGDHGKIKVSPDDRKKLAEFRMPLHIGRKEGIFKTRLQYDQILNGWGRSFTASPRSLYDSIYQVYDQIGEEIKKESNLFFNSEDLDWNRRFRDNSPRLIRKLMESHFLEYFSRYHENILISYKGDSSSNFDEPKIFWEVLKEFPILKLQKAVVAREIHHNSAPLGPCPEYILETPEEELDVRVYFPSESALMDVFWGMYLKRLTDDKGYPSYYNDQSLRHFIARGNDALSPLRNT